MPPVSCDLSHRPSPRVLTALWLLGLLTALIQPTWGHVGSPDVHYEGFAGPYPIRVVIQTPPVVPGLAPIHIRVRAEGIREVTALPIKWDAGRKGAPPPDVAERVPGETNLFSTQLWFMTSGAHGVLITVDGPKGKAEALVPVDAVATRRLSLSSGLTTILSLLGITLVVLLLAIARAALAEALVDPGMAVDPRRKWMGRISMVLTGALLIGILWGGRAWWKAEDQRFVRNKLYQPPLTIAEVAGGTAGTALRVTIDDPTWEMSRRSPILPDHGYMMHGFLVKEPGLDAFAHLHPHALGDRVFTTQLPPLPSGTYQFYGDITLESGFNHTLLAEIEIPSQPSHADWADLAPSLKSDDTWLDGATASQPGRVVRSGPDLQVELLPDDAPFTASRDHSLKFQVLTVATRQPARLGLYMGMPGHVIIRHQDGSVFTHLHPQGTASMASIRAFAQRELDINAIRALDDTVCGLDAANAVVTFPYAFPKAGRYRLWLQFKANGRVRTSVFDVDVR